MEQLVIEVVLKNVAIVRHCCDAYENPVMTTWGCAEVRREFNDRGWTIKESYYDADGKPVLRQPGFAACECEYRKTAVYYFQRSW